MAPKLLFPCIPEAIHHFDTLVLAILALSFQRSDPARIVWTGGISSKKQKKKIWIKKMGGETLKEKKKKKKLDNKSFVCLFLCASFVSVFWWPEIHVTAQILVAHEIDPFIFISTRSKFFKWYDLMYVTPATFLIRFYISFNERLFLGTVQDQFKYLNFIWEIKKISTG